MFRLLALLCAGLFLTLLIAGRDEGQARSGLQGAYDIAALKDGPARPAPKVDEVSVSAAPAEVPEPAAARQVPASAQAPAPRVTPVAFTPSEETATGLTLSLPLVAATAPLAADPAPVVSEPALLRVGRVLGTKVNVREAPSAKAAVLDQLAKDETVTVISTDGSGWTLVRIEGDGIEGYIASRYLSGAETGGGLFPSE